MIWLLVDSSTVGGIERHVATLAEALRRRDIATEVVLLADHGRNPWLEQLAVRGIPFRVLAGGLGGLSAALTEVRPLLLHTHGYKAGILGRIAATWRGIPVVATFHAGERGAFPVSLYQGLDAWSSFLVTRLAVSEEIRAALPFSATLGRNFLLVPELPPAGPLPRRVGFVGRLSHEKGPDRFCALARARRNDEAWHVYGDGPMRGELEAAYGDAVTFHGLVTDLEPVWASLGLLVMPSRAEGLPMAALEALSNGVPVLASAVGDLPRVIEHGKTGWLVDSGDQEAAQRHIAAWRTIGVEDKAAMRVACWTRVRDNFSEAARLGPVLDAYAAAGLRMEPARARAA